MSSYYDVTRIVYDLIKYDRHFRQIWQNLLENRLLPDVTVSREDAIVSIEGIRNHLRSITLTAQYIKTLTEMIDVLNKDLYNNDPLVPLIIARKTYFVSMFVDILDRKSWNYYYPETEAERDALALPYDNFPVLANDTSREYVRILSENTNQYIDRLVRVSNRERDRYTIDQLVEVCSTVDGVSRQMTNNPYSYSHNENVHKVMLGIQMMANNTTDSPYTAVLDSVVLSQGTLESMVYNSSIQTSTPIPMVNKISMLNDLYGPLYEYTVGTVLNRYMRDTPGFMYSYGYYNGLPPSLVGNRAAVLGYMNNDNVHIDKDYYEGFFQYIPNSITLGDFVHNRDRVVQLGNRILSHEQSTYLLYLMMLNNVAYMNSITGFVHGDLHYHNVMVSILPQLHAVNLKVYNNGTYIDVTIITNAYVYIIDYGFSVIRYRDDQYLYSKILGIPVPIYFQSALQDIHSILFYMLLSTYDLVNRGIYNYTPLTRVYRLYSMLFTGVYSSDVEYSTDHYDSVLKILSKAQKYVMPQDTTYPYEVLQFFNESIMTQLSIVSTNIQTNTLFNIDTSLIGTSTDTSIASVYLLNLTGDVLIHYYPSILDTLTLSKRLSDRISRLSISDTYWKNTVDSITTEYINNYNSVLDAFKKHNNQLIDSMDNNESDVTQLVSTMYRYSYNLRLRTILKAMSKYYNIDNSLLSTINNQLTTDYNTLAEFTTYLSESYTRMLSVLNTKSYANLMLYAYGTYNYDMIDGLSTRDIPVE